MQEATLAAENSPQPAGGPGAPVFVLCGGAVRFDAAAVPAGRAPRAGVPAGDQPAGHGRSAGHGVVADRGRGAVGRARRRAAGDTGRGDRRSAPGAGRDDRVLPGAAREAAVLRQEPGHGAVRRAAAADLSGGQVPVPVPAPDGCDRVPDRGLPLGPERVRVRPVHRGHAGQPPTPSPGPPSCSGSWPTTRPWPALPAPACCPCATWPPRPGARSRLPRPGSATRHRPAPTSPRTCPWTGSRRRCGPRSTTCTPGSATRPSKQDQFDEEVRDLSFANITPGSGEARERNSLRLSQTPGCLQAYPARGIL